MDLVELLRTPAPRSHPVIDRAVRAGNQFTRWFLYSVITFDLVLIALVIGASHADDRLRMGTAMVVVLGIFSFPFYVLYRRKSVAMRGLFVGGELLEAVVTKARTGSMRGTPIHHIRVEFADDGQERFGRLSMAGGAAGIVAGAGLTLVVSGGRRKGIFAALTPSHGVQAGRYWSK